MQPVEKAEYIYNSNALDGITLSIDQTKSLVFGEIDPLAVEEIEASDGEVYETAVVSSHLVALNYVLNYPRAKPLTEVVVREIHTKCFRDVLIAPGEYREHNPRVPISFHVDYTEVPDLMKLMSAMLQKGPEWNEEQDIFAWKMHHELCGIHPFVEGNGRTGRLLMNLIRSRFGLGFEVVSVEEKDTYIQMINDYIRRRSEL